MSAKIETLRPDTASIVGYIDELTEDRVYGWAWDRRSPRERIEIQVWIGDRPVAIETANRARADLRSNGVGDGQHAFEIALPETTAENVSQPIRVFAKPPGGGEMVELQRRQASAAPTGNLDASLRRIFDELEMLRAAQRVLGKAAHATLGDLRKLSTSGEAARAAPIEPAVDALRSGNAALLERLTQIEAVMMRVDASLAELTTRVDAAAAPPARTGLPVWFYGAGAAVAAAFGAAIILLGVLR